MEPYSVQSADRVTKELPWIKKYAMDPRIYFLMKTNKDYTKGY